MKANCVSAGMWITDNVVEGQILCNLDQQLTIANNLILSRGA